jgi:hypothetical protein
LANVFGSNWFAAGNTVYVGDNHAESQSTTINLNPQCTATTVSKILCHNHSGNYPPASSDLATGATISLTGNSNLGIAPTGPCYFYGITFKQGVGASTGAGLVFNITTNGNGWICFDRCSLQIANTVNGAQMGIGNIAGTCFNTIFNNTTVSFGNVGDYINVLSNQFTWQNTGQVLASGSSVPTTLLNPINGSSSLSTIVLEALDLSQLTGNLIAWSASIQSGGSCLVKDCKLNASMAIPTPAVTGAVIQFVRCDSGATAYKSARYQYEGTETTETSITRIGGAADPTGQAQTRKIVTTVNAQWLRPFKAEPYAIWNATTGANVTVTLYGTINAGALPNNDDIWMEVEYLGSSGSPLGTIGTTTKASLLAANAAVASDSSSWNGGGSGAGWSPFKLTTTLSSPQPGMAGYIEARVRTAKASTTYYLDPMPVLT